MPFKALKLSPSILKALADEGYERPTPIQQKAIPPILEGRDVLGCAQTGTGKTAAFALPIIQRLAEMPADKGARGPAHPRALILSPTRELAAQIGESFATYGRHAGLSHTVIFGGVSQHHQVKAIHRGVDVLIATPGRLLDLMEQRIVTLKSVGVFVLDEADRMLDMGFIDPIRRIASQVPGGRQTLLFSATMPREIVHLAESLLRNPVRVAVTPVSSAVPLIEQRLYMAPYRTKQRLLEYLLEDPTVLRALVFTKTKHGADRVCKSLHAGGVQAIAIHGNKAQNYRTRALDAFRSGKARVLVATDVAARGLDVDGITHVFNFDLPMEPEAYVHRIGRTGRAGATGIAISFCDPQERDLLRAIQRLTGKEIPARPVPGDLPTGDHAGHAGHAGHGGHGGQGGHGGHGSGGFERERPAREERFGRPAREGRGDRGMPAPMRGERPGATRGDGRGSRGARPERAPEARSGDRSPGGYEQRFGQSKYRPPERSHPRPQVVDEHRPARPARPAPAASEMSSLPGAQKKGHRKGQGPATKPTRNGAQAEGHDRGHAANGSRAGSPPRPRGAHPGAHPGAHAGGRPSQGPNRGQSGARRGGPGGGTRGRLNSDRRPGGPR